MFLARLSCGFYCCSGLSGVFVIVAWFDWCFMCVCVTHCPALILLLYVFVVCSIEMLAFMRLGIAWSVGVSGFIAVILVCVSWLTYL